MQGTKAIVGTRLTSNPSKSTGKLELSFFWKTRGLDGCNGSTNTLQKQSGDEEGKGLRRVGSTILKSGGGLGLRDAGEEGASDLETRA